MAQSSTSRPTCPSCGKKRCTRNYTECASISTTIPQSLGHKADVNTDKLSKDEKHKINQENTEHLRKPYEGPMPDGGTRVPVDARGDKLASRKQTRSPKKRKKDING